MENDKVRVSIEQIQNGYVINRSWCEMKKDKEDYKYHHEEYFMKTLPPQLGKLFEKSYMKDSMNPDVWESVKGEKLDDMKEDDD